MIGVLLLTAISKMPNVRERSDEGGITLTAAPVSTRKWKPERRSLM